LPLVEPKDAAGNFLREKLLVIAGAGGGKTTAWLSIAHWAFISGDTRKFYVLDTDDEAVLHVLNEPKYHGMLYSHNGVIHNEGGNLIIHSAYSWDQYREFANMEDFNKSIIGSAMLGDFIVVDFMSHSWAAAQDGYLRDAVDKTRDKALYEAGVSGASGWDMFKTDFNWNAINGSFYSFSKAILLQSRAHVFMTAEEEEIQDSRNMAPDAKEHVAQFGRYKGSGLQKKVVFQCRSYLRIQRLARGRVLHTLKDRARPEYNGDDMKPDFFSMYLKGAGWTITDPE
jgi:hypothetical protein